MVVDPVAYNKEAWDRQVDSGDQWTLPVTSEVVERARSGDWSVVLTPTKPVPREWFGPLEGQEVLGLASAGGQQGPIFAAVGARVTIFDNSEKQLGQDRMVAERDGLSIETVQGDMQDLSVFDEGRFDLIFHPVSNCFVPDVRPVWKHAARVLKPGGALLAGFCNPVLYTFGLKELSQKKAIMKYSLPCSELDLTEEDRAHFPPGSPVGFSHTLEDQIGGQLAAGLQMTHMFEDRFNEAEAEAAVLNRYLPLFIATRTVKPK